MRTDVTLRALDEETLAELLGTAVADADPLEVMPPVTGPPGWTPERRAAFLRFHRSRSLAARPVESTFAVVVGARVVGAARLCPLRGEPGTVEAGLWIGRPHRAGGVGGAVFAQLLARARAAGYGVLYVSTTPGNTAVQRIVRGLGGEPVRDGDEVTARIPLRG